MAASWGIVTTTNEPAEVLVAFAVHHLSVGAEQIHFYLDEPDDDARARLTALPGCTVTICDADFYRERGKPRRPEAIEYRQVINAQHAYDTAQVDWLAHIDADEMIWPERSLAEELAHVPAGITRVKLDNLERAYVGHHPPATLYEGAFRVPRPVSRRSERQVLGPAAAYTLNGVTGHYQGKSLTRTGWDHLIGIHSPRPNRKHRNQGFVRGHVSASSVLLHFDGLTPLHWASKIFRFAAQPRYADAAILGSARAAQIGYVREHGASPQAVADLHRLIKTVSPQDRARLGVLGFIREIDFAVGQKNGSGKGIAATGPGTSDYDDHLVRRFPELAPLREALGERLACA